MYHINQVVGLIEKNMVKAPGKLFMVLNASISRKLRYKFKDNNNNGFQTIMVFKHVFSEFYRTLFLAGIERPFIYEAFDSTIVPINEKKYTQIENLGICFGSILTNNC